MAIQELTVLCCCVSLFSGLGLRAVPDEVVLGQMRDWNEELQTARELPTDTPAAKVFRDRTLFKVQLLNTAVWKFFRSLFMVKIEQLKYHFHIFFAIPKSCQNSYNVIVSDSL